MQTRVHTPRRRRLAVLATVVAALTITGATTVDANRGQPDHEVPIHGTFEGVDKGVPVLDETDRCFGLGNEDGFYQIHYTSTGTAHVSHLGRVEMTVDHCTWVDDPFGPTHGSFGDGAMVMTAANGDVLVLEHWGTFVFEGPYSIVDQHWQIVDMFPFGPGVEDDVYSTGRFAGATGSGTGDPISNLIEGTIAGSMSGMIAYDASNRADR